MEPISQFEAILDTDDVVVEPLKKSRKRDKSSRWSHSSPRRHHHGARSSSQPLPESIFGASRRFSEFVHTNLDGPSRRVLRSANVSSLTDSAIELATRSLLIAKRLREETINGVSTTEFENVKKELVESSKSLESDLEANLTLTNQIKELSDVY